jgi:ribonuclease R
MQNTDTLQWQAAILEFFNRPALKPLKLAELAAELGFPRDQQTLLRDLVQDLARAGALESLGGGRYAPPAQEAFYAASLLVFAQGFGIAQPEDPSFGEIRLGRDDLGAARHRDRVLVAVRRRDALDRLRGRSLVVQGRVVKVLERRSATVVGVLRKSPRGWRVIPDDARQLREVRVTGFDGTIEPHDGRKVVAQLDDRHKPSPEETGRVTEDLGDADDPAVDMIAVMRTYALNPEFPPEVLAEVEAVSNTLRPEDLEGRRDLRAEFCFTIDPADARDHDDACSLRRLSDGTFELGVHIADVSHFVRPGTALDREAFARATSAYLADRVIPMLPNRLTTDLCSLVPYKDRLAHTVALRFRADGTRLGFDTFPSVIHSKAKLSYDQVQAYFDGGEGTGIPAHLRPVLDDMRALAAAQRRLRMKAGAIGFDVPEVRCRLDAQGVVTHIEKREPMEAYQLVEDFMLAANQAVAEFVRARAPHIGIYRVHEVPQEKQWRKMEADLLLMGLHATLNSSQDINRFVTSPDVPEHLRAAASVAILRNLKRAHYGPHCKGHFGLAFDSYTHFTSPIRRYPDLVIHRVLKSIERGEKALYREAEMHAIAKHCSEREQNSEEAERYSQELKKLQFYHTRLYKGEVGPYPATVTAFNPRGMLVELDESLQRGLIPFQALPGEWQVDGSGTRLRARRSGAVLTLGDGLPVQLARVDLRTRRLDLVPAPEWMPPGGGKATTPRSRPPSKAETPRQGGRGGKSRRGSDDRSSAPRRRRRG